MSQYIIQKYTYTLGYKYVFQISDVVVEFPFKPIIASGRDHQNVVPFPSNYYKKRDIRSPTLFYY